MTASSSESPEWTTHPIYTLDPFRWDSFMDFPIAGCGAMSCISSYKEIYLNLTVYNNSHETITMKPLHETIESISLLLNGHSYLNLHRGFIRSRIERSEDLVIPPRQCATSEIPITNLLGCLHNLPTHNIRTPTDIRVRFNNPSHLTKSDPLNIEFVHVNLIVGGPKVTKPYIVDVPKDDSLISEIVHTQYPFIFWFSRI